MNTAVIDLFMGDSGKGKLVDYLAKDYDIVARFNGSNNAGHTLKVVDNIYKTHAIPSGVLYNHTINFISHGCVIDPYVLASELKKYSNANVVVSGYAHVLLPWHKELDIEREKVNGIGSTKSGVAPAFEAKHGRYGLRFQDFCHKKEEFLEIVSKLNLPARYGSLYNEAQLLEIRDLIKNQIERNLTPNKFYLADAIQNFKTILFEGAQGFYLDPDYGNYPYVTSSGCTVASVLSGGGIPPRELNNIIGVFKAYGSYVGEDSSFDDIKDVELNDKLCELGGEYGTTTNRRRRLSWLDLDMIKNAMDINGSTELAITKLDVIGKLPKFYVKYDGVLREFEGWAERSHHISSCRKYYDLPLKVRDFISFLEMALNKDIKYIGVGQERHQLIERKW